MNIYLIRHGEKVDDDKNHGLLGLTEKGIKQANLLGKRLSKCKIDCIYSSNMKRAIETATEINRYTGVEITIKPDLREIHMGACDELGWSFLKKNYPEFIKEFDKHETDMRYPPNGECGEDVWKRASKVINEITLTDFENVVIVTHGGVIRALICGLLGLGQERRFLLGVPPQNCGISMIKYDKQKRIFYIHTFNNFAHLEEAEFDEIKTKGTQIN